MIKKSVLFLVVVFGIYATGTKKYTADVVVYGDASGGVAAAVQAARMGKKVILVSQYGHLGGMTSSGLGATDMGDVRIVGGISYQFYHRMYTYYMNNEDAWSFDRKEDHYAKPRQTGKPTRRTKQGSGLDHALKVATTFEPKVAEMVFGELIEESGVQVIKGRIDLKKGVKKRGTKITALYLENGDQIRGKMFIDASYEGDLLARAGVSFAVGREANAMYNEIANGVTSIRPAGKGNQLPDGIDPYMVKGDPSSGLLPGVNAGLDREEGEGDHRLQAYCYRMVLTNAPENRIMIEKPESYREADYEILFRAMEQRQNDKFFKVTRMPNRKTDSNNNSGISCDYIGMNYGDDWDWTTLSHEEREELALKHKNWQLGLVWTVQNHPRVPVEIREKYAIWGLPKDEFTDNKHWPYNLYVREGRRMVSDFVMNERHCRSEKEVPQPVAMGAYTLDSHHTQRVVWNGMVKNEGDIQNRVPKPYGISYKAIVPKRSECTNLLVPWALSASHMAFGSIRMEPVFMNLGQSSATAAVIAIDDQQAVQDVPYDKLKKIITKDQMVVELPPDHP